MDTIEAQRRARRARLAAASSVSTACCASHAACCSAVRSNALVRADCDFVSVGIQSRSSQDAAVKANANWINRSGDRGLGCEVYRRRSRASASECVRVR